MTTTPPPPPSPTSHADLKEDLKYHTQLIETNYTRAASAIKWIAVFAIGAFTSIFAAYTVLYGKTLSDASEFAKTTATATASSTVTQLLDNASFTDNLNAIISQRLSRFRDELDAEAHRLADDILNEKVRADIRATVEAKLRTVSDASAREILASIIPPGTIAAWPSRAIPAGWAPCDGRSIDKAWNGALQTLFPSGHLPDLRGQFLRGASEGSQVDPDGPRAPLTPQGDAFRSHSHPARDKGHWHTCVIGTGNYSIGQRGHERHQGDPERGDDGTQMPRTATSYADIQVDPVGGAETRPTNVAVVWIVKVL